MSLHEGMAWNDVRSMNLGNVPKITSSYGFNEAWVTQYDDPAIIRARAAVFTDPTMTRFPRSPIPTSLDGYDDAVEDGSGSDDGPVKTCKKRKLTLEQTKTLEISFDTDNKLEGEKKLQLAKELGLKPRQVAVWFQNRRARWKTKRLEQEYAALKSGYDAIVEEKKKLVEENKNLKAEVERLTAKRQRGINPSESNLVGESTPSEAHGMKLETLLADPASIKLHHVVSPEAEITTLDVKPTKASSSRDQSVTSTTNSETNNSDVMDEESPGRGGGYTRATVKLGGEKQSNAGGEEIRKRWTDMAKLAMDFGQEYADDAIVLKLEEMTHYQSSYETVEPYVDLFGAASEHHHLWYFSP